MTDTLAQQAATHWGAEVVRLLSHRENAVYEIRLPGGARAALRLHRPGYQDFAAIRSELWWCAALAGEGVAVPAALPHQGGDLLAELPGGRAASVIEWVAGIPLGAGGTLLPYPPAQTLRLHHAFGALVAQFHAATDRLTLPADFTRPRWDIAGLVGEAPLWGRFWDHPEATPTQTARLAEARDFLHDRMAAHLAAGAKIAPIHADLLRENIFVDGDRLSLIDFDDSGWGFRLFDLGTALAQNLDEPAYADIRDALMQGYGTADRAMVETFTLMRCCASVGWAMTRLGPGDPVHPRHLARALDCAARVIG
ncbi:phosphotransferase enzyme family protein [Fuscibacter oryzae]|uniref:Phosphotransferase n=1 Tax=Fuscibacter oryzae TaxID=2803939 RepID=A0A8J7SSV7_9RHOB|nr:phosphotransferase [Fuscibacter oryzae]MBL4927032.1 phosphotransferase [Fuscibacter oryzae]